ncbi:MAG: DUF4167 domain-containing protein [Alphaproteobacteria bacterium]
MRSPQDRRNNRTNNQRRNNNGGQNRVPIHSRQFESAGPSGKLKGTAKQLIEKYMGLSRDYYSSGDDVNAETCKQFAEHYSRLIGFYHTKSQNQGNQNQQNQQNNNNNQQKSDGEDKSHIKELAIEENPPKTKPKKNETSKSKISKNKKTENIEEVAPVAEEKPKRRGRPKKTEATEVIAITEVIPEEKPKRRGRPKKAEVTE